MRFTLKIIKVMWKTLPVVVTIIGTWQKQYCFSSLLGVAFTISVDTGEVLDFEVM